MGRIPLTMTKGHWQLTCLSDETNPANPTHAPQMGKRAEPPRLLRNLPSNYVTGRSTEYLQSWLLQQYFRSHSNKTSPCSEQTINNQLCFLDTVQVPKNKHFYPSKWVILQILQLTRLCRSCDAISSELQKTDVTMALHLIQSQRLVQIIGGEAQSKLKLY